MRAWQIGAALLLLTPAGPLAAQAEHRDHAPAAAVDTVAGRIDSLAQALRSARGERRLATMPEALAVLLDHHAGMRREMGQHKMEPGGMAHGGGAGKPGMDCPMMRPDSAATAAPKHNH